MTLVLTFSHTRTPTPPSLPLSLSLSHTNTHTHIHTLTLKHTSKCIHLRLFACVSLSLYIYICMCVCVCVCVCAYFHAKNIRVIYEWVFIRLISECKICSFYLYVFSYLLGKPNKTLFWGIQRRPTNPYMINKMIIMPSNDSSVNLDNLCTCMQLWTPIFRLITKHYRSFNQNRA